MEVVVSVHAGRTTTSEAEARFRSNAARIQGVVVVTHYTKKANNNFDSVTATIIWMDVVVLEHSYDNVHTAFSRLTTVEEGIRGKAPSSYEISLPAEPQQSKAQDC